MTTITTIAPMMYIIEFMVYYGFVVGLGFVPDVYWITRRPVGAEGTEEGAATIN